MRMLLAAAALIWSLQPGQSQTINGNILYENCTADFNAEPFKGAFCYGYITGVTEGLVYGVVNFNFALGVVPGTASELNEFIFGTLGYCPGDGVINDQIIDVVVNYLANNPAIRHESARYLIIQSFREAFPCT